MKREEAEAEKKYLEDQTGKQLAEGEIDWEGEGEEGEDDTEIEDEPEFWNVNAPTDDQDQSPDPSPVIAAELLDLLACPACEQRPAVTLADDQQSLQCTACGRTYPILDGIPVMLVDEAE